MKEESEYLIDIGNNPSNQQLYEDYKSWLEKQIERLKVEKNYVRNEFYGKLAFLELQDEPEPDVKRMQRLAADLNPNWLAVVSKPIIANCGRPNPKADESDAAWWKMCKHDVSNTHREKTIEEYRKNHPRIEWDFVCPKKWNEMKPTENRKVRFCEDCKKNVYFCDNIIEARELGNQGCCVGIDVGVKREEGDTHGEMAIFGTPSSEMKEEYKTKPLPDRISAKRIMKKVERSMRGKTSLRPDNNSKYYEDSIWD